MEAVTSARAGSWADRINACWRASVEGILEVGRLLTAAKADLPHGEFEPMIAAHLPFTPRTAQMLMAIATDPRLANPKHVSLLPASWGTMYELTKLDDATFDAKIGDGSIRPDIERSEVAALRKEAARAPQRQAFKDRVAEGCAVDDLHSLAEEGWKAATILADPPWRFLTRSEKGQDRSPKYRTDRLDEIKKLPVENLAAPNSVLLVWCVDWALPEAIDLIETWGFTYKTVAFTWTKQLAKGEGWHMGQGYWTRANPEMCLLGTKGHPTRLDAAVRQLVVHPIMEHSRKPDEVHDRIERLVGGPYLELYARRVRPGWKCWGNEIARRAFEESGDGAIDAETGEIIESEAASCPATSASPEPVSEPDFQAPDAGSPIEENETTCPLKVASSEPAPEVAPSPAGADSPSHDDLEIPLFLRRTQEVAA